MSWLYSQALVEEYLGDICLDGEQSVQSNGNPIQQAYLSQDKMTKFSRLSRFGMTFKPLTDTLGEELLMLYLEGFHAKTLAQPVKVQELTENDQVCGNTWQGSLARLDPDTLLWKTAQCSLLEDLEQSLQTFPRWGLMRSGALYPLPMLVQTISEKEYGLDPNNETFFHTPNTTGMDGGSNSRKALKKRMWLTPRVVEIDETPENFRRRMNSKRANDRKDGFGSLTMQVKALDKYWPTPDANCGQRGTQPNWTPKRKSGQPAQYTINQAVRDGYATPTARMWKDNGKSPSELNQDSETLAVQAGGQLNPTWVEWLMGWPLGWTDLKPLGMDKCHCAQQQPGNCLNE